MHICLYIFTCFPERTDLKLGAISPSLIEYIIGNFCEFMNISQSDIQSMSVVRNLLIAVALKCRSLICDQNK